MRVYSTEVITDTLSSMKSQTEQGMRKKNIQKGFQSFFTTKYLLEIFFELCLALHFGDVSGIF